MERKPRYQLAWSVCILLLIGFVGNSVSNYLVSRNNVRKTITESSLPLTSDNIYSVIQRDLLQPIFISSMMSTDAFLRSWIIDGEKNITQIERFLSEIVNQYNTVTSFLVSEKTKNYYYADGILKQVSEEEPRDEWYFRVRDMAAPFEINVDPDLANQDTMTIFINYRVFDFDGNFIGATGTGLTVNRVNLLIEEYERRFGRHIFFCDREGNIVLSPQNSILQNYTNIQEVEGLQPYAEDLLQNEIETLAYKKNSDVFFLNSRFIPELDWFLLVEQTEDILLEPLRKNLYYNLALALIITVFVAVICISTINRNQRKLQARNEALSLKNEEIELQRRLLQETTDQLSCANKNLSQLNEEKDDFLGVVAHDLRNPLNGVIGFCEEIQSRISNEKKELQEYIGYIRDASQQMLELTSDILNVSFIEGFHKKANFERTNWNDLVQSACKDYAVAAQRKNITMKLDLASEVNDIKVKTLSRWIDICLNNLISNAIKYSPPNSTIYIATRLNQKTAEVSVQDEGPGITPEDQKKLFQKFVRGSSQPTGTESSTGLGLYIVKKMCDRLGARIELENEPGKGCRFVIHHPI